MTPTAIHAFVRTITDDLSALGDPQRAQQMAAYMKTTMPFHGVPAKVRDGVLKAHRHRLNIQSRDEYEALILALWTCPHREEKYLAVRLTHQRQNGLRSASLPLYERLIREGAWWDFVDELAGRTLGPLVCGDPDTLWPIMDAWIDDESMWVRRSALLCQLYAKAATRSDKLFDYCARRAHEREFFIRKAIGWALRQYARIEPHAVVDFMRAHRDQLSRLSLREGGKHLIKQGLFVL